MCSGTPAVSCFPAPGAWCRATWRDVEAAILPQSRRQPRRDRPSQVGQRAGYLRDRREPLYRVAAGRIGRDAALERTAASGSDDPRRKPEAPAFLAFGAITSLFFAWGFITSNNDPLIVALRAAFRLDYREALLTQIVFFLAYGLLSLPAAWLMSRFGPVDMILGSLAVWRAAASLSSSAPIVGDFWPILAALFVLAGGFTALQVAANPLAAELGSPERTHFG